VWVAVERLVLGRGFELGQLLGVEDRLMDLAGLEPLGDDLDCVAKRHGDDDLDGFGENRAAEHDARL
jgi:hypothetical protein